MKLSLDELFKLFEEVENSTLLERPEGSVSSDVVSVVQKEKVLKIPRLYISENWGNDKDPDRQDLIMALKMAGYVEGDPIASLNNIQAKLEQLEEEIIQGSTNRSTGEVLSQLIVIETLNRLYNSFQSSPLGFVNEAFVSVLYGTEQQKIARKKDEKTGEKTEVQIGDVKTKDGFPISVKTITRNSVVGGSLSELLETINRDGKVFFDIFLKDVETQDKKTKVNGVNLYRFFLDKENISEIIPDLQKDEQGNVILERGTGIDWSAEKSVPRTLELLRQNDFDLAKMMDSGVDAENVELQFKNISYGKRGRKELSSSLVNFNNFCIQNNLFQEGEQQKFDRFSDALLAEVGVEGQTVIGKQFKLTYIQWSRIWIRQGRQMASISFSKERVNNLVQNSLSILSKNVFDLFEKIDDFSKKINLYFSSETSDRASTLGKDAVTAATQLPEKTQEIVEK